MSERDAIARKLIEEALPRICTAVANDSLDAEVCDRFGRRTIMASVAYSSYLRGKEWIAQAEEFLKKED